MNPTKVNCVLADHFRRTAAVIIPPVRLDTWAKLADGLYVRRAYASTAVVLKWRTLGMTRPDDLTVALDRMNDLRVDQPDDDTIVLTVIHTGYADNNLNFKCDYDIYIGANHKCLHAVSVSPCAYNAFKFRYVRDVPSESPFAPTEIKRNLLTGDDE